jgi:hypothetical protein
MESGWKHENKYPVAKRISAGNFNVIGIFSF